MFVMTSVLCISFFYVCDDFGTVFCRVYGDFNNTTVFTAFVVTSTLSFVTISVVVWWFWFYRFDVFVVTSVVMFTVSAVVSLYEHCPRLLTFVLKFILIYFYGSVPNQFFVNRTPEKTELLDDINL